MRLLVAGIGLVSSSFELQGRKGDNGTGCRLQGLSLAHLHGHLAVHQYLNVHGKLHPWDSALIFYIETRRMKLGVAMNCTKLGFFRN